MTDGTGRSAAVLLPLVYGGWLALEVEQRPVREPIKRLRNALSLWMQARNCSEVAESNPKKTLALSSDTLLRSQLGALLAMNEAIAWALTEQLCRAIDSMQAGVWPPKAAPVAVEQSSSTRAYTA